MSTTGAAALFRGVRTVLLDFDGPVCSIFAGYPAPVITRELAVLSASGGHSVPENFLRKQDPLDVLRFAGTVGPELVEMIENQLSLAELEAVNTAQPTPGADAFLRACRATGRTVAILSNNSEPAIARYLKREGLAQLVARVEGRDPANPRLMKPNPRIVSRALRHLAAPAATAVMIGDSPTDIEAGMAATVRTIGYANKAGKHQALTAAGADVVITTMADLAKSFETHLIT